MPHCFDLSSSDCFGPSRIPNRSAEAPQTRFPLCRSPASRRSGRPFMICFRCRRTGRKPAPGGRFRSGPPATRHTLPSDSSLSPQSPPAPCRRYEKARHSRADLAWHSTPLSPGRPVRLPDRPVPAGRAFRRRNFRPPERQPVSPRRRLLLAEPAGDPALLARMRACAWEPLCAGINALRAIRMARPR